MRTHKVHMQTSTITTKSYMCKYTQTHTHTHLSLRITVWFGYTVRTHCYLSLCSSIHPEYQIITPYPLHSHFTISTPHPAATPAHTAWQCQLSARKTTGGMRGLGPEITNRVKIDPGNGDVTFPNPLTSNPHISISIVWFALLEG